MIAVYDARSDRDLTRLPKKLDLAVLPKSAIWVTCPEQAYRFAENGDLLHGFRIWSKSDHLVYAMELMSAKQTRTYIRIMNLPL